MQRLIQLAFWAAILLTLYLTLKPITVPAPGSDKTQHLVTFGLLMVGAALAYPRARPWPLAAALSGLGAAIEVAQPWFGRACELLDWFADTAGVVIGLVVILAWKTLLAKRRNPAS